MDNPTTTIQKWWRKQTTTREMADGFCNVMHVGLTFPALSDLLHEKEFRMRTKKLLTRILFKAEYDGPNTNIRVFLAAWLIHRYPVQTLINQASEHRDNLLQAAADMVTSFSTLMQDMAAQTSFGASIELFVADLEAFVEIFNLWIAADSARQLAAIRVAIRAVTNAIATDTSNTQDLQVELARLLERERQISSR